MLRKTCIRLSLALKTSVEYFLNLTLDELVEILEEYEAMNK